ncbi:MAG: class I SAM-dependent methyltransferase [Actinoplanes sp.]
MATLPERQLHQSRPLAESFGTDAARYDQARPAYPDALIARVLDGSPGTGVLDRSPGTAVLDVGCGTGIAARQFQAAGCTVLGVEPDPRMADFARGRGLPVEVATFEAWPPAGRTFDTVIAAQSWHWVDPAAGALKAAQVLRPGGRLAIFGHVFEPPAAVAEPLAAAFQKAVPDSPFANLPAQRPLEIYQAGYAKVAGTIRDTHRFSEPELWQFDVEQTYTREQWLALLPTTGGLTRLPADKLAGILTAVGTAIDALGGRFTMQLTTLALTAVTHVTPPGEPE